MTAAPGTTDADLLLAALAQRLLAAAGAAAEVDLPPFDALGVATDAARVAVALPALVAACLPAGRADLRWLTLTAVHGAFPTTDEVLELGRRLDLTPVHHVESWLLEDAIGRPRAGRPDLEMTVVTGGAVVDVDFCARHDTHTGIHRVVRATVPRWTAAHAVTSTAWIDEYSALRTLAPREHARVHRHDEDVLIAPAEEAAYVARLVVPWRTLVVLPDVPNPRASDRLAALGRFSGSTLGMIGYDLIPITSAELRPDVDAIASAQYLTVVKRAHRVAGISASATAEFQGFVDALAAQGLTGPVVREVPLTEEAPPAAAGPSVPASTSPRARPVVLLPGTREPHKNQRTVLHAAERLWREGLDFEVRLVGGRGWSDEVLAPVIARLVADGRPVADVGRVPEAQLWQELRGADVVAFLSLHEGYGLPVAEALACGRPVLTSRFGSQAEIAAGGGCLTVDPRDDDDVTAGLRRLLTDPAERTRLAAEAAARTRRTWDEYAEDLWAFLVPHEGETA